MVLPGPDHAAFDDAFPVPQTFVNIHRD